MKRARVFKIIGITLALIIILFIGLIGFGYYRYQKAFDTTNKPYKNYIGYINQENALLNSTYKLCNEGEIYHTYSSAGLKAYAGSKKQFRDKIKSKFNNNNYTDSGYVNFRFLVNCEGQAGWFEIIKMDLNLQETGLNQNMVDDLFRLTSKPEHWNIIKHKGKPQNYYMYVSYRIEDGKITEIIP